MLSLPLRIDCPRLDDAAADGTTYAAASLITLSVLRHHAATTHSILRQVRAVEAEMLAEKEAEKQAKEDKKKERGANGVSREHAFK